MDEFEPPAVREALQRVPEIVHGALVQVIQLAPRIAAPDQCRHSIDEKAELTLAPTQRVFGLLPLVDVGQQHTPATDVSAGITEWKAAVLHPAINTIPAPDALDNLIWSAGSNGSR